MPLIKGQVLDTENNPIRGIWVRIYREDGRLDRIDQAFTDDDGSYALSIDPGSLVIIRYDDRRFSPGVDNTHPALDSSISGTKDQHINKVLHQVSRAYSFDELLDILSTYERIYFMDTAEFIPLDNEVRRRYPQNLSMIKWVDALTEQRLKQVLELYKHPNP